jgi:hypothetical protein
MMEPVIAVEKWAMRVSRAVLGIKLEVSGLKRVDSGS